MRRPFLVLLLASAACHDSSSGSSSFLALGVNDLGIDAESIVLADGVLAARAFEAGVDVNGDGDGLDSVLRILDLRDGRAATVPEVAGHVEPTVAARFVAFAVPESSGDLNGDGDELDSVLHVHDVLRGSTRNLELALTQPHVADGAVVAAIVQESEQGVDLDGDGHLRGAHLHVYEAELGRTTAVPVSAYLSGLRASGGRVLFLAEESEAGDRNDDGDELDSIPHVYDVARGTLRNTERAVESADLDGALLALTVAEWENGGRDLNSNGSVTDTYVELLDLDTGARRALPDRDASVWGVRGGLALVQREDEPEHFLWAYDLASDTLTPLVRAPGNVDLDGVADRRIAYAVDESEAGVDLDGDGELDDSVLHLFDARTGATRATRIAVHSAPRMHGTQATFLQSDGEDAGDPFAPTRLAQIDSRSVRTSSAPPLASDFLPFGALVAVLTPEEWERDLNGDQDEADVVLRVFEPVGCRTLEPQVDLAYPWLHSVPIAGDGDVLVVAVDGRLKALRLR